jgi:CRP-like cAMP-binding protein
MLVEQGSEGTDLYLLLDGVLGVEVDGEQVAEMGPGTMLGERASLEGGVRTATLRALTPCRVTVIPAELVSEGDLAALAADRRREG